MAVKAKAEPTLIFIEKQFRKTTRVQIADAIEAAARIPCLGSPKRNSHPEATFPMILPERQPALIHPLTCAANVRLKPLTS